MIEQTAPLAWTGKRDQEAPHYVASRWHQHVMPAGDSGGAQAGILGFCCDDGVARNGGRVGAAEGPSAIRRQLANLAWHESAGPFLDFGDISVTGDGLGARNNLEHGQDRLAAAVAQALPRVGRLAVLGGGHETAYGSFRGLNEALGAGKTIGIVNLDAHFDLRFPGTAGASSGTPFYQVRQLVGAGRFRYACLGVAEESNTQALFARAEDWQVRWLTDREMRMDRLAEIRRFLDGFLEPLDLLYLTLDLDVLPHFQAPGVSAPAARGVPLEVVEAVIDHLTARAAAPAGPALPLVEIVELNPLHDQQSMTARTAALLLRRMLRGAPPAAPNNQNQTLTEENLV